MPLTQSRKAELTEKIAAGERLDYADGVDLYAADDLAWLGGLAHGVRTAKNSDITYFNVNRHLNLTNVCAPRARTARSSASRESGRVHDAHRGGRRDWRKEMEDDGITELHIVNGLHPTLPWRYYPRVAPRAEGGAAGGRR